MATSLLRTLRGSVYLRVWTRTRPRKKSAADGGCGAGAHAAGVLAPLHDTPPVCTFLCGFTRHFLSLSLCSSSSPSFVLRIQSSIQYNIYKANHPHTHTSPFICHARSHV